MSSQGGDQGALHTQVVQAIRQYLDWCKAWNLKVVGGSYQRKGIPDILACWRPTGRLVAVEVKTGQGRLSAAQEHEMDALAQSGAVCIVAASIDDVEEVLIKLGLLSEPLVVSRAQAAQWRVNQSRRPGLEETQVE
jgi:VRR-NUC domain-containing protein